MKQYAIVKKQRKSRNPVSVFVKMLIIICLLSSLCPSLFGLSEQPEEIIIPDFTSPVYFSVLLPDVMFYSTGNDLHTVRIMHKTGLDSSLISSMDYIKVPHNQDTLLKNVGFWSWMTIGGFGLNCLAMTFVFLDNGPIAGMGSMISHTLFGISNAILTGMYADLDFSVSVYGPKEKRPTLGLIFAASAAVFAGIGVGIGSTMFDGGGPDMESAIATGVTAGISNILGIGAFVYYLLYENSLKAAPVPNKIET